MTFRAFLARRLITFLPTVLGVVLLTYLVAYAIPADPVRAWAGGQKASPQVVEFLRNYYHFNDPWYVQFYYFFVNLLKGQLIDPITGNNVFDDIARRFSTTLQLTLFAMFFSVALGVPLGLLAAYRRGGRLDGAVRIFALVGVSMPAFLLAYLMILLFFVQLRAVPLAGVPTPSRTVTGLPMLDALLLGELDTFASIVNRFWLPGFVLGFSSVGVVARFVRNSVVETLESDFVPFLQAQGLPEPRVRRHVERNSLVPIVTILGLQFGGFLSGAPITETIFALPGIGSYAVQAIYNLNFPAMIATTFIFALIYVLTNLALDIAYAYIDPRVRYT